MRSLERRVGLKPWSLRGLMDSRTPQSPSIEKAEEICRALGLEFYIGEPRRPQGTVKLPPVSPYPAPAARVRDRRLAEILASIVDHYEALDSDYARQHFLEDLWAAGGSGLRAQGSGLSRIVAWLGWQVIAGGVADDAEG